MRQGVAHQMQQRAANFLNYRLVQFGFGTGQGNLDFPVELLGVLTREPLNALEGFIEQLAGTFGHPQ